MMTSLKIMTRHGAAKPLLACFLIAALYLPGGYASAAAISSPRLVSPEDFSEVTFATPIFRWEKVPGAEFYSIYVSCFPYGSDNLVYANRVLKENCLKIPGGYLADGEKYRWNVRAHTKSASSVYSETFHFQIHFRNEEPVAGPVASADNDKTETPVKEIVKNDQPPPVVLTAQDWYLKGNEAFDREEYDTAISHYTKSIESEPTHFDVYNNRGNAYVCKGEYDKAVADFDQALKLKPDLAMACYNRGLIYAYQKEYDKAIIDFGHVLKLNPKFPQAYYKRGTAYGAKNEYAEAVADFNRAILLNPEYAEAYYGRAIAYSAEKEYVKALADIKKSIALGFQANPQMVDLLLKINGEKEHP